MSPSQVCAPAQGPRGGGVEAPWDGTGSQHGLGWLTGASRVAGLAGQVIREIRRAESQASRSLSREPAGTGGAQPLLGVPVVLQSNVTFPSSHLEPVTKC